MPWSKTGREYFTDAQYKVARVCSALEYAKRAGYDLVRTGNAYHLREHDSMIFTLDGKWFWNSQNLRGGALEFMQYYENRSLPEAVNLLAPIGTDRRVNPAVPCSPPPAIEKTPFELPEKSPTFKRLFAYLCQTRKLDVEIVQELVEQHRVYESDRYRDPKTGEIRKVHNVVFVGFDSEGHPQSAFKRGTNTYGKAYKGDVAGSDKKYAFCCPGRGDIALVAVFEASIDAISHATLAKLKGCDWSDRDRIALGGVAPDPLLHYLQLHPGVQSIQLCLDNDGPGKRAAANLTGTLENFGYSRENGYEITADIPPIGKDWNEYLCLYREALAQGRELQF